MPALPVVHWTLDSRGAPRDDAPMIHNPSKSHAVRCSIALAVALVALGGEALASRAWVDAPTAPARTHADAAGLSLDAAIDLVQRRFRAKVIRADVAGEGDSRTYVLRLLSEDGRVWTVRVDAASGAVSE